MAEVEQRIATLGNPTGFAFTPVELADRTKRLMHAQWA
jgi:hypothetical protein